MTTGLLDPLSIRNCKSVKKLNLHLYWESETLLSPISAQIEMVVYEHKVFMTLVNILLSALRHWLSTAQGGHNKNSLGKSTSSFIPVW